jgi:hypothetical protein
MALLLAIFAASWLERRNTEKLLKRFERRLDVRFDTLLREIRHVAGSHPRWNAVSKG